MKITKTYLKQIIKEEFNILLEGPKEERMTRMTNLKTRFPDMPEGIKDQVLDAEDEIRSLVDPATKKIVNSETVNSLKKKYSNLVNAGYVNIPK